MPIARFEMPDGRIGRFEVPDGTTPEQAQSIIQQHISGQVKQPGFGEQLNAAIKDAPRQLGLAARYGVEGLADVAGIFSNPIAATANAAGAKIPYLREATSGVLDRIGLPKPQTPTERVVGDASRMLAGGGGMVKLAKTAGAVVPVFKQLAERAGLQAASATGAGLSGGYTRETGGNPLTQGVASVVGGVVAPAGVAGVNSLVRGGINALSAMSGKQPANINIIINQALEGSGYKPSSLPLNLRTQLSSDVAAAMRQGDLSPDALRRLIDYRLLKATPARGNLTLNPVDVTNQHNLTKIGANSSNANLQGLAMRQNNNTGTLIRNLNEMGANTADDAYAGGQKVIGALERTAGRKQGTINEAYNAARAKTGIDAEIDPSAFTQRAGDLLKQNLLEGALPADVRRILNDAANGRLPLTVSTAEQIKTAMGNLQRSSADGGTRRAIGLVRQALDDAPLLPGRQVNPGSMPAVPGTVPPSVMAQGDDAIQAFNRARGLNRSWRGLVEKTPALQAIEDGVQPDRFVQDYIIRGAGKANVMDVARLKNAIKDTPEAVQAVREQILAYLKSKALNGKPDEAMTFSQSGYNNAFSAIGERKLRMFFSRSDIDRMKAVGRVAMYEQIQPSGSAVNNSNSGALAVAKVFDLLANSKIVNSIPFGQAAIGTPAKNIAINLQGSGISNVPNALLSPKAKPHPFLPLPLLFAPGLSAE